MKTNKKIDELVNELGKEEILNYLSNNQKPFDYKDIKTFEDACEKIGINPLVLPDVSMIDISLQKSIIANYKLCIVYKAINNGWEPDFNNLNEHKYYPWFKVLPSGLDYSSTNYGYDITGTNVGVRLCTDTAVKAQYIGTQFKDLYQDYFL